MLCVWGGGRLPLVVLQVERFVCVAHCEGWVISGFVCSELFVSV